MQDSNQVPNNSVVPVLRCAGMSGCLPRNQVLDAVSRRLGPGEDLAEAACVERSAAAAARRSASRMSLARRRALDTCSWESRRSSSSVAPPQGRGMSFSGGGLGRGVWFVLLQGGQVVLVVLPVPVGLGAVGRPGAGEVVVDFDAHVSPLLPGGRSPVSKAAGRPNVLEDDLVCRIGGCLLRFATTSPAVPSSLPRSISTSASHGPMFLGRRSP